MKVSNSNIRKEGAMGSEALGILHISLGVLLALFLAAWLVYWYVQDITQKRHTVLRNYPIVGHLRYFFEKLGEYFRQYFFLNDQEERPFDRATRGRNYRLAKNEGGIHIAFNFGGGGQLQGKAGLHGGLSGSC